MLVSWKGCGLGNLKHADKLQLCVNECNRFEGEALRFIPCKSALGKHCPEPVAILPSSYIAISSDTFSLKGLFYNAIGQL